MDILRYKLPLKVILPYPIKKSNGYSDCSAFMEDIDFNSINQIDIDNLDGQYDWIDVWMNRDYDKKMSGFNNKDVLMEVAYDKGNYIITLVSEKPFSTIVRNNRYYSSFDDFEDVTLKEAILRFLEGCIWDGIGENEIGHIIYQGHKCDVWMGHDCLTEI